MGDTMDQYIKSNHMHGDIEQFIALVSYGNAYLAGRPLDDFYPGHTVFMYCKEVKFKDCETRGGEAYADDPLSWFARLKEEGYWKLQLRYVYVDLFFGDPADGKSGAEERKLAEFADSSVNWVIEATRGSVSDFWITKSETKYKDDSEKEGNYVVYERIPKDISLPTYEAPPLKDLKKQLEFLLTSIRDFANKIDLKNFGNIFDNALSYLEADDEPMTNLIYPDSLSDDAYRLLLACRAASGAFGGMGSWTDEKPVDRDNPKLTDELYELIQRATEAAVNSQK